MKIAYFAMALRASAHLREWQRKIAQVPPGWLFAGVALAVIVSMRLLPASSLATMDRLIGRPGDALLLLAVLFLGLLLFGLGKFGHLFHRPSAASAAAAAASSSPVLLEAMLDHHLQLDAAIDEKLSEVVVDTEQSALGIIAQVRHLYDCAARLVAYLESSSVKSGDLGQEIIVSVNHLVDIGAFIAYLPARMERDIENVQHVAREIKELSSLCEGVQAISMQSHMLAINASIEASRAGDSGLAFRVIAHEMRHLASNSGVVAGRINEGLARARMAVEGGIAASIAESSQQIEEVSHAVVTIQKIQDNFEDMRQYYKTRFAVVTQHNEDLAKNIAEVLGQIQYQDVVRQCIERICFAIKQRNAVLEQGVGLARQDGMDLAQLSAMLATILDDYLNQEARHKHSGRHGDDAGTELKIELF